MRPHRATVSRPALAALLALSTALALATAPADAFAQGSYKIEPLKAPPPEALSPQIRQVLNADGYRVLDGQGKPYAELWLCKAAAATQKPGGPSGAVQFPFLQDGELLGALRFPGEGHDNRDQAISKGVYTVRYGLQPVNGDHLGVSPYRDYVLLLPASKDKEVAIVPRKPLEERSAEAAGTSHPAVLMLVAAPASGAAVPSMVHDEEKDLWGAVVPLNLAVKGAPGAASVNVQVILFGVVGG
jgi:hypothetical protein